MGWSWRIARLFGIDIYVHFTFVLLLAYVGIIHYLAHYDLLEALMGVMLMVLLFSIVVLHELGHALTARRFGIRTRDIILLPIGGVARLERIPEKPVQELLVAVARAGSQRGTGSAVLRRVRRRDGRCREVAEASGVHDRFGPAANTTLVVLGECGAGSV
jgi:Zn-dependent protease